MFIVEVWLDNRKWGSFPAKTVKEAIFEMETALVCSHMERSVTVYFQDKK